MPKKLEKKIVIDVDVRPETVTEENLAPTAKENTSEIKKETTPAVEPKIDETSKNEVKKDAPKAETSTEKKLENLQEKK